MRTPYGYQNGRFHLIRPVRFRAATREKLIPAASRFAVVGRSLFDHADPVLGDLQLTVVGEFPSDVPDHRTLVARMFAENHVRLFDTSEVDRLIEDIRENAQALRTPGE